MVSKEQVREMEGLFVDTVTKLSARVNFLETQSSSMFANPQQQQPTQQYQPSSNNTSRIKIEPGGKIRALSLIQPAESSSLAHGSSGKAALSTASQLQVGSNKEKAGLGNGKLW